MEDKVFDINGTLARVENDVPLLFELVEVFFEDYEPQIQTLEQAISSNQAKSVESIAHSLKSALGNLGANRAFNTAAQLEKAGRNKDNTDWASLFSTLKLEVDKYKAEFEAVRTELERRS